MRPRRGFTVLEMMISMVLLLAVFATATTFFRTQMRGITAQSGRFDAQQNAQYAVSAIDRDLRIAGVGVVAKQPLLVQASPTAITFNGDLVTRLRADPGAIYFDPDADPRTVMALAPAQAIGLPNSGRLYPDSAYPQGPGVPGTAETVSFWLADDSSTTRLDDYVMMRRANDAPARVVARSIVIPANEPVFRYFTTDSLGRNREVAAGALPMYHLAAIHGSPADTGSSRRTDSVRVVRVRVTGVYTSPDGSESRRTVETSIRIMNAGLINRSTCGEDPLFGAALAATVQVINNSPQVRLTWAQALDEASGERDVERYVLFRRPGGALGFGEPFASIAAGLPSYQFVDTDVLPGDTWVYGVAAQDCTPASSAVSLSPAIVIP